MREFEPGEIRAAFAAALGPAATSHALEAPGGAALELAVGLARGIVARPSEVADGAAACVAGMLLGAHLPPQDDALAARLFDAVATVRSFGRHAVIAQQCDLGAVAEVERAYASTVARGSGLTASTLVLFELGLALALAARQA
jgi:hypothetical protein